MLRRRVEARIVLQRCMSFGMNCYEARCFGWVYLLNLWSYLQVNFTAGSPTCFQFKCSEVVSPIVI